MKNSEGQSAACLTEASCFQGLDYRTDQAITFWSENYQRLEVCKLHPGLEDTGSASVMSSGGKLAKKKKSFAEQMHFISTHQVNKCLGPTVGEQSLALKIQ